MQPLHGQRLRWLAPTVVGLLTFAVFLPAVKNGFVDWDDPRHFLFNTHYRGLGLAQLRWMFTTMYNANYQPLSWVTLGFDYTLWGMNPAGYHLTNIALHSLNAAVFYFLAKRLIALALPHAAREQRPLTAAAMFSALFFALHPLRVESVAWISERRDVLSGFFYLLALLAYLQRRLAVAAGAFALSLLSKGMGVTLPATLLLLDIYPLKRLPGDPRRWLDPQRRDVWTEKAPFLLLALGAGAVGLFAQARFGPVRTFEQFGLLERVLVCGYSLAFYLRKTLLPFDLLPLYEMPYQLSTIARALLISAGAIAALTAALVLLRKRFPGALAAWAYYAIALAPVSGLVQFGPQIAADRYSYLPCLGAAVLAGAGLLLVKRRTALIGPAILALAGLSILTVKQVGVWRDSQSLWRHTLAIAPAHAAAHTSLGFELVETGQLAEGMKHLQEALRLTAGPDQNYVAAHYQLGKALLLQGRLDAAMAHLAEALRIDPRHADVRNNIGNVLMLQGRVDEAVFQYRKALEIKPEHPGARKNLAIALRRK